MTIRSSMTVHRAAMTALVLAVAMAAGAAPDLSFESDRIIASGITTNGLTWWFGAAHTGLGWEHRIITIDRSITDHDDDGVVELIWEDGELPKQSAWLVIDVASGEYTMAAPPGSPLRQIDLDTDDLVYEASQIVGVSQEQVRFLEVMLAQPNSSYWRQTSGDGSPHDDDGSANGKIVIRFADMEAGEGTPATEAPGSVIIGDVVAVIDALELKLGVYGIDGGAVAASQPGGEVAR